MTAIIVLVIFFVVVFALWIVNFTVGLRAKSDRVKQLCLYISVAIILVLIAILFATAT